MATDQDALQRKNQELTQAYNEKTKKLTQTQELYDKVKRKAEFSQMRTAVSEAMNSSLPGPSTVGYGATPDYTNHQSRLAPYHGAHDNIFHSQPTTVEIPSLGRDPASILHGKPSHGEHC